MPIQVHVDLPEGSKRITARSPWYKDAPVDAKRVPGGRWDKPNKQWTYPLTIETCHALRRVYGDRLVISKSLAAWARNAIALENKMRALGTSHDADLDLIPKLMPFMDKAMANRTYQRSGAKYISVGRRVGVFDEVGLGKTIVSIGGVVESGSWHGNHLVVSNKTSLRSVWGIQLDEWTEGKADVYVCDQPTAPKRRKVIEAFMASTAESKWLIVNKEMLRIKTEEWCPKCKIWQKDFKLGTEEELVHATEAHKVVGKVSFQAYPELLDTVWSSVIVDEAHKILSTGVKSGVDKGLTQTSRGLKALREVPNSIRVALTGTPTRGKELNLWGIMHWLWEDQYPSKWNWVDTFFEKSEGYGGHAVIGPMRPEMQDRFWSMMDRHTIRRTRREVRADLPQAESYTEWVFMEGKHLKQYTQMVETGEADLDGGDVTTLGVLAEMTRLKQFAFGVWDMDKDGNISPTEDSPKLRRLDDMLEERGVTGDPDSEFRQGEHYKYIVASQFKQVIDLLKEHYDKLGIATCVITGDITGQKRAEAVDSFQNDPDGPRVMLMTSQAGGESITLDRYCDTIFCLDESFVADDGLQLMGRIDNRSVSDDEAVPRKMIHISTKHTIEEGIAESNISQLEMEERLLDARRGAESLRLINRRNHA